MVQHCVLAHPEPGGNFIQWVGDAGFIGVQGAGRDNGGGGL